MKKISTEQAQVIAKIVNIAFTGKLFLKLTWFLLS